MAGCRPCGCCKKVLRTVRHKVSQKALQKILGGIVMQSLELDWPVAAIEQSLAAVWPDAQVEVLPQVASSNTTLLDRARAGQTQPTLLVAERQTAGRGRMGRQWLSLQAAGGSLTFSLGVPLGQADVAGLSLVVGHVLAQALDPNDVHQLRVKWPNDLWLARRKLGGVLIEISSQGTQRQAVIGVGINIQALPPLPEAAPGQVSVQAPAWVQEFAPHATAPWVLEQIAAPLAQAVQQFIDHGFAPWQPRFAERDALQGQAVRLSDGSQGVARGINATGALRVQLADGTLREVHSSEISLRPVDDAAC